MNKRQFLATFAASALPSLTFLRPIQANAQGSNMIKSAGVTFEWHHVNNRLVARLAAPTSGWIAVGFNSQPGLRHTRFVIADVTARVIRVEEHLALVPTHPEITTLGLTPAISDTRGAVNNGVSQLWFSMAHTIPGPPPLNLSPGRISHLMLAWSRDPDFDHHSAWRRHFEITL